MPTKNIHTINASSYKFLSLKNTAQLSKLLYFEFANFVEIIEFASYREFNIPKANGGKRIIEAPNENLLCIQKMVNVYLQAIYYKIKPNPVYGFVISAKGELQAHSIISNAQNHVGKNFVLNIDLKDFFHSISAVKVRELFQRAPFNFTKELATCLALICCWNKRLPMGAPTSPVVSNLYCLLLDYQLLEISNKYSLVYTRYADDLTFSSEFQIQEDAIAQIKNVISENKFLINERKFRLQSKYRQQTVTGIKVNQKTNVDRCYIRNIRAILNDIKWNGLEKAAIKHYKPKEADDKMVNRLLLSITGKINFIGQVRGKTDLVYTKLRQELGRITLVEV
jgi:RNA-directed DNA polymerase